MNKKTLILSGIVALLAALFGLNPETIKSSLQLSPHLLIPILGEAKTTYVKRVIDGDTIVLGNGRKVRYIGVDAPEIFHDSTGKKTGEECGADKAYLANKKLVEGKTVRLEKDISETDKYGRLLRYVYLPSSPSGELFVNDYLMQNGFTKTMTIKPDIKYASIFLYSQNLAKEKNIGLWKECSAKN